MAVSEVGRVIKNFGGVRREGAEQREVKLHGSDIFVSHECACMCVHDVSMFVSSCGPPAIKRQKKSQRLCGTNTQQQ
ncbi:unnamed protein product [Ectocarpus sp. 6 AP-2014]